MRYSLLAAAVACAALLWAPAQPQARADEIPEKYRKAVDKGPKLKDILTRAVKYIGNAQSSLGGWYYTAKGDTGSQIQNPAPGLDEGSVTITQMQALRACRNAGIPVPKAILDMGVEYLSKS